MWTDKRRTGKSMHKQCCHCRSAVNAFMQIPHTCPENLKEIKIKIVILFFIKLPYNLSNLMYNLIINVF